MVEVHAPRNEGFTKFDQGKLGTKQLQTLYKGARFPQKLKLLVDEFKILRRALLAPPAKLFPQKQ